MDPQGEAARALLSRLAAAGPAGRAATDDDDAAAAGAGAAAGGSAVKYRAVLLRSAAMQAYTLQRRDGGLSVPGLGAVAVPVPAGLRAATKG